LIFDALLFDLIHGVRFFHAVGSYRMVHGVHQ